MNLFIKKSEMQLAWYLRHACFAENTKSIIIYRTSLLLPLNRAK